MLDMLEYIVQIMEETIVGTHNLEEGVRLDVNQLFTS